VLKLHLPLTYRFVPCSTHHTPSTSISPHQIVGLISIVSYQVLLGLQANQRTQCRFAVYSPSGLPELYNPVAKISPSQFRLYTPLAHLIMSAYSRLRTLAIKPRALRPLHSPLLPTSFNVARQISTTPPTLASQRQRQAQKLRDDFGISEYRTVQADCKGYGERTVNTRDLLNALRDMQSERAITKNNDSE
jgi:hypothetical protein